MQTVGTLRMTDAVALCHALVAHVAESLGLRVIFIKGPISAIQGLRPPKDSMDVDVMVSPEELGALINGLQLKGWRLRPSDNDEVTFPAHSVTLYHATWPSNIDVHFRFPGMERTPVECFDALWLRRTEVVLAARTVSAPSAPLGICILALHALRSPWLAESKAELVHLKSVATPAMLPAMLEICDEVQCMAAMHPFLTEVYGLEYEGGTPPPSDEWVRRTASRSVGSARLIALVDNPWGVRAGMLRRAINPSKESLLARDLYADVSLQGRVRLAATRWARFVRSLPKTAGDVVGYLCRSKRQDL